MVSNVTHRTGGGRFPDVLANAADQAYVVKFLESVDAASTPVFDSKNRPTTSSPIAVNINDHLIWSVNPSDNSVSVIRPGKRSRSRLYGWPPSITLRQAGRSFSRFFCRHVR